ncbi:MAG: hypothetical protein M9920_14955 [Verrucomicrobiae bacterium]|nr:hypothetical protein [Verrucomicrobiae bacterium]
MIKSNASSAAIRFLALAAATIGLRSSCAWATPIAANSATPSAIPWSEIGSRATATYQGDGLVATPTRNGAQLNCVFQRLEGEVTAEGLWLTSTPIEPAGDCFRVTATRVSRNHTTPDALSLAFPTTGTVVMEGQVARFNRPGLVEEYSVSLDGIRQDFILAEPPAVSWRLASPAEERMTAHEELLRLELAVNGAAIESTAADAQLTLAHSGRQIAYSRLHVTDAVGRELPARFAMNDAGFASTLAILVDDQDAVYPIRIDPTFSDVNWVSMGDLPGADSEIFTAAVDAADNLYVGGQFHLVGNTVAGGVAKWDGQSWSDMGTQVGSVIRALAVNGTEVYASGTFVIGGSVKEGVAKWDGQTWQQFGQLGPNPTSDVLTLTIMNGDVYAGGDFVTIDGVAANRIARWDGINWHALGTGLNASVRALAELDGRLYVGGWFTTAGDAPAFYIAEWDGSNWQTVGGGLNQPVNALLADNGKLYVGGGFTLATNADNQAISVNRVAQWDGSDWNAMGGGFNQAVRTLTVWNGNLYAAGNFTQADGKSSPRLAQWNGTAWNSVAGGLNDAVNTLVVRSDGLFVGGAQVLATNLASGPVYVNRIAHWNGNAWRPLNSGFSSWVYALAASETNLYVGGNFNSIGDLKANYIARWDGTSWSTLQGGMNNPVYVLTYVDGALYAGGFFTLAGPTPVNGIAKWNGNAWSAFGIGMNNPVHALAVTGTTVYAGGEFTKAGNVTVNRIAKWNGSSWSALDTGMNNQVSVLKWMNGELYAGGWFTTAGDNPTSYIAKWNGTEWLAVGGGVNDWVYTLEEWNGQLLVGGSFTTATNSDATTVATANIARWDGTQWHALGTGLNGSVRGLAVVGSDLYVGGWFTSAGGNPARYLAKWDGTDWSPLGSGLGISSPYVEALATLDNRLFVGGRFMTAGGKVSPYLAQAILGTAPIPLHWQLAGDTLVLTWDDPSFTLESAPEAVGTYVELPDAVSPYSTTLTGPRRFFRLKSP